MPNTVIFDDEFALAKGSDFIRLIEDDIKNRQVALNTKNYIRHLYFGLRRRKLRYKGQSNIHLPVLAEKIETLVPKEMNAFWGAEPHAHARRVSPEFDEEETQAAEQLVNWAVDTDIPDFYETTESWFRDRHIDGNSFVKIWYNYEQRNTVVVEEVGTMWEVGDIDFSEQPVPADRPKTPAEILGSKFAGIEILEATQFGKPIDPVSEVPLVGVAVRINFVEKNIQYSNILVEFHPSKFINTIKLYIFRPIDYKDNVEVDNVDYESLVVPYRAKNLQSAERIAYQYWLTIDELRQKIEFEGWNITPEEFESLKSKGRAERFEEMPENKTLRIQKDTITGNTTGQYASRESRAKLPAPYVGDRVLIFEVYATDDLDNDGVFEEMIYQVPYALEKVVKAQYLEEVFPHGQRPFAVLSSIPISNRFYSWSYGQLLAPVNVEVNVIINSINDAQEVINNPWFFYVPAAMPGDPKIFKGLEPGSGVPVADVNGVFFPKFAQQPLANLSTMDTILMFADRITVSPQAGGSSQVRNAPRTARGTLALLSEGSIKIDSFITAAQKGGWADAMYQIYALYEAYAAEDTWYRVTGRQKPRRVSSFDLRNKLKFVFKGNTVNTNREVMRSIAQMRYALLRSDPLYVQDPAASLALIENVLHHFGEGADVDRLLPKPAGLSGGRQPLTQVAENQIMAQGVPLQVLPTDDDSQHMQVIEQFQNSPAFDNLDQAAVAMIASHFIQHQQQLLQKQQQGQQQAGQAGGLANNQPVQLGDLEGGVQ